MGETQPFSTRCNALFSSRARARLRLGSGSFGRDLIQTSLAPIRRVLVNNATLGRFIERGDERAAPFSLAVTGRVAFRERTQIRGDAAIAQRAARALPGAFGSGFRVGHESEILDGQARGLRWACQAAAAAPNDSPPGPGPATFRLWNSSGGRQPWC